MLKVVLVIMTMFPGAEAKIVREDMTSYESCLGAAVELRDAIAKNEGNELHMFVGCEIVGTKATKS